MFNRLFGPANTDDIGEERQTLRQRLESWHFRRDLNAIMASLDRLSDRRLEMIGLNRDTLFDSVSEMMIEAAQRRQVGLDVIEMLDRPTVSHLAGQKLPERSKEADAAAAA